MALPRFFFSIVLSLTCAFANVITAICAPVVRWLAEAFPRPEPTAADRHALRVVALTAGPEVDTYVERRLARTPSRRRGPWFGQHGALPLAV